MERPCVAVNDADFDLSAEQRQRQIDEQQLRAMMVDTLRPGIKQVMTGALTLYLAKP
jgi:hypothetical protein